MRIPYHLGNSLFLFLAVFAMAEGSAEDCIATASCSTTMQHMPLSEHGKPTTVEGVELPGMRHVDGVNLYRNGHGMRFIPFFGMNIKIYVAAMYTAKPILSDAQAMGNASSLSSRYRSDSDISSSDRDDDSHRDHHGPLQLDFTFLRYVGQSRVVSAWTQQLDHSVTHRDYEGYEADRDRFIRLASGGPIANMGTQSVQLVGDETRIIDQGKLVGAIRGRNFQRSFLSMWFGSEAVCEDLKSNLLRGDEHHPSVIREVQARLEEGKHETMQVPVSA